MAIPKPKSRASAMVGVRNSRHFGMSANYAMQALPHDMIGIAMTNASRQVVPTFGREARFGTNPMCFAVPADKELPFVLDMATKTAAAGKLELAARLGKSMFHWVGIGSRKPNRRRIRRVAQAARRLLPLGGSREERQPQRLRSREFSSRFSAACSAARSRRSMPTRNRAVIFSAPSIRPRFDQRRNSKLTWTG